MHYYCPTRRSYLADPIIHKVLEALTEIPFPRNENLCTRFATEIILRRGLEDSLTIKVIPDSNRPISEQISIKAFKETIQEFKDLPEVMAKAMDVMGIESGTTISAGHGAFARDVLSIEIEGPTRPQLTLVDIPGLIRTATGIVTDSDIDLVAQITHDYISQPRTICLAVVAASQDYATQEILKNVLVVDPKGDRTLGIITKPDRIDGPGSKQAFLELAQNLDEKVRFKLGWHVLKNRSPQEADISLEDRKLSESKWFHSDPFFRTLPTRFVGIDSLRQRLSLLLFEHVKRELPQLRQDLENAMYDAQSELDAMGKRRATAAECKEYLFRLSMEFHEVCKAAVDGHYEGAYFRKGGTQLFDVQSATTLCRVRAVVQSLNTRFADNLRRNGQKYIIDLDDDTEISDDDVLRTISKRTSGSINLSKAGAIKWVRHLLSQTRGKELSGNFNPMLIGELFWQQASNWGSMASAHVDDVAECCSFFLRNLLEDKCPRDVQDRVWEAIKDELKARRVRADEELEKIMDDLANFPINYNHYYTDTINKRRQERQNSRLGQCLEDGTQYRSVQIDNGGLSSISETVAATNFSEVVASYAKRIETDMEKVSCEEALDALFAIYKVSKNHNQLSSSIPPPPRKKISSQFRH
jgi:hypothetical protein